MFFGSCRLLQSALSPFWATGASDPGIYRQIKSLAVPRLLFPGCAGDTSWRSGNWHRSDLHITHPYGGSRLFAVPGLFIGYFRDILSIFCQ